MWCTEKVGTAPRKRMISSMRYFKFREKSIKMILYIVNDALLKMDKFNCYLTTLWSNVALISLSKFIMMWFLTMKTIYFSGYKNLYLSKNTIIHMIAIIKIPTTSFCKLSCHLASTHINDSLLRMGQTVINHITWLLRSFISTIML